MNITNDIFDKEIHRLEDSANENKCKFQRLEMHACFHPLSTRVGNNVYGEPR